MTRHAPLPLRVVCAFLALAAGALAATADDDLPAPVQPPPPTPLEAESPGEADSEDVADDDEEAILDETFDEEPLGAFDEDELPVLTAAPPRLTFSELFHGSIRVRYHGRFTGSDSDNDGFAYLRLNFRDEDDVGLSGSFYGRLSHDIDGHGDDGSFFVFDSVTDSFTHRVNGRVYHAYVDYRPCCGTPLNRVRVGRQQIDGGEFFLMDGVHVRLSEYGLRRVQLSVFGGVPTHLFEGSPDGDVIAGASLSVRPWGGAEARADFVYLEDDNQFYGEVENDLLTLSLRQTVGPFATARASYQHFNGEPRYGAFAFDAYLPRRRALVRGAFRGLFTAQNEQVFDLDPFFAVAQRLEPYFDAHLAVSKELGRCFHVEGGIATRRLFDDADEGTFNREYQRYHLSLSSFDWPCHALSMSLTGEWWQGDEDIASVTFDLDYRPSERWRIRAGTDFALYRFDFFGNRERQNARGVFVRATYRPGERWRFDGRVRVDHDDFDTYTTVRFGAEMDF